MKVRYGFALLLVTSLSIIPQATAQEHEHAAGPGRELGQVEFLTSCRPEVQEDFSRAVAMLHSFWYQEAEEAFTDIAIRDSGCAMAGWGIAMSRFHPLWERPQPEDLRTGLKALEDALAAGATSERERGYVEALLRFYEDSDSADHLQRIVAYEEAMKELQVGHPDDREAAVFHALALLGVAYSSSPDPSYSRQKEAGAILEEILAERPDHPGVTHYIIHSYDFPELAEGGLAASRQYAKIAPAAPHALHMPSHIFTRLGHWEESISSNRAAAVAARENRWTGEELHATDYLAYAYLQGARDEEAKRIVDELPGIASNLKSGATSYFAGVYAMAAIPARYAVERRQWEEASMLAVASDLFPGGRACWAEATLHYARGLGAARTGKLQDARHAIEELKSCKEALLEASENLWANQVEVATRGVTAWLALAEGDTGEALATMRSAADLEDGSDKHPVTPGAIVPARELLGVMLLEVDRPGEALAEFEAALRDAPNRFRSLHGAARAAHLTGDDAKARRYYSGLVEVAARADTKRPELLEAESFLKS